MPIHKKTQRLFAAMEIELTIYHRPGTWFKVHFYCQSAARVRRRAGLRVGCRDAGPAVHNRYWQSTGSSLSAQKVCTEAPGSYWPV